MSYAAVAQGSYGEPISVDSGPSAGSDSEEELLGPNTHAQHYKLIGNLAGGRLDGKGPAATAAGRSSATPPGGMSRLRKILFFSSIALCVLTIVVFMFVLPCDVTSCTTGPGPPHAWSTPLLDYETFGKVEVVGRGFGRPGHNIVLIAKQNITVNQGLPFKVVCLEGGSGNLVWWHVLSRPAESISCRLLDVNRDNVTDCIVSGQQHLLKAIDPVSGLALWDYRVPGKSNGSISEPAVVGDVDGDGVEDIVTCQSGSERAELLLLSGRSGRPLSHALPCPPVCVHVAGIVVEGAALSYTCTDSDGKQSEQTAELSDLLGQWHLAVAEAARDPAGALQRPDRSPPGEAHVDGHRLLVDNQGYCPDQCRVQVVVKDRNNHTLYNRSMGNVYGTSPVPLTLTGLTGFLLKCWHKRGPCSNLTEVAVGGNSSCWEWTERVTLLTFNVTDVHVVNVSQRGVVQLCYSRNSSSAAASCQPHPHNAYYSMRLSDMDGDGKRELVSVTASHIAQPGGWRLHTQVTAVRLENDLHLLYDPHNYI